MNEPRNIYESASRKIEEDFTNAYNALFKNIKQYCKKSVYSSDIADDLAQRVFTIALTKGDFDFSDQKVAESKLVKIAEDVCNEYKRNNKDEFFKVQNDNTESFLLNRRSKEKPVDLSYDIHELHELLGPSVESLNNIESKIFYLKASKDLTLDEIQEETGLRMEDVVRVYHNSLKKIADGLGVEQDKINDILLESIEPSLKTFYIWLKSTYGDEQVDFSKISGARIKGIPAKYRHGYGPLYLVKKLADHNLAEQISDKVYRLK